MIDGQLHYSILRWEPVREAGGERVTGLRALMGVGKGEPTNRLMADRTSEAITEFAERAPVISSDGDRLWDLAPEARLNIGAGHPVAVTVTRTTG